MRKISLIMVVLFIIAATPFAIQGQVIPMLFNVFIAGIFLSIYIKLPSAR